jgi:hypothetical protein
MKEATIYGMVQYLDKKINQLEQSVRLGLTGEVIRAQAFQQLLIKKGLITEAELTEEIGVVIKKANEPKQEEVATATEAQKVELTTPTPEQVSEVQKSIEETK